ncbi:MAG: hypothetical protein Q8S84_04540 [bacterium]|nr:hypothetical protein [bacterium]
MNLTSHQNFGQIALPFGLHICFAKLFPSTIIISLIFSSSFIISS